MIPPPGIVIADGPTPTAFSSTCFAFFSVSVRYIRIENNFLNADESNDF